MPKISEYTLTTPSAGDDVIIRRGARNYRIDIDNFLLESDASRFVYATYAGWLGYSTVIPTRASADDPTYVIEFAGVDLTGVMSVGNKIKWTQNSIVRYGIITQISFAVNTSVTILTRLDNVSSDYDVLDSASFPISDFYFSYSRSPLGFPMGTEWELIVTDTNDCNKNTPTINTWYGDAALTSNGPSINIPIGLFYIGYKAVGYVQSNASQTVAAVKMTLSSASNSESETKLTTFYQLGGASATLTTFVPMYTEILKSFSSKATYYLNVLTTQSTNAKLAIRGDAAVTFLRARCAYI